MTDERIAQNVGRLAKLYTGAVADVMDDLGFRTQALPREMRPLEQDQVLAGVAFTVRGRPLWGVSDSDPRYRQIDMLEAMTNHSVVVLDPGGEETAAHWGELMSATASAMGCRGAVINGGLRDTRLIRDMDFPVFGRFFSPLTAVYRWELTDFQTVLQLGQVEVAPGDYIIADDDGVLCIPARIITEVLDTAEDVVGKERMVLSGLRDGKSIRDLFEEYKVF